MHVCVYVCVGMAVSETPSKCNYFFLVRLWKHSLDSVKCYQRRVKNKYNPRFMHMKALARNIHMFLSTSEPEDFDDKFHTVICHHFEIIS